MEKLEQYRHYVKQVITEYSQIGWKNRRRYHGCVLHLDIKKGKIWIQHDGTEVGIANELVNLGVPKEDIVLAFHEPLVREYTGFAVG